MSITKRIRGLIAIAGLVALTMTVSAPKAVAFEGLGGASSGGKHWVEI